MAEKPVSISQDRAFIGMASNVDPADLPSGIFQEIINMAPYASGAIVARAGTSPVSFEVEQMNGPDNEEIWSMYGYRVGGFHHIITESDIGKVYANEGPYIDKTGDAMGGTAWREIYDCASGGLFPASDFAAWFATMPGQILMAFTGLDRPLRWDGATDCMQLAGIDAPTCQPIITHSGVSDPVHADPPTGDTSGIRGNYAFGIRYVDANEGQPGNLSALQTVFIPEHDDYDPDAGPPPDLAYVVLTWNWEACIPAEGLQGRIDFVQLWRSNSGQSTVLYLVEEFGVQGFPTLIDIIDGTTYEITSHGHGLIAELSPLKEVSVMFYTSGTAGLPDATLVPVTSVVDDDTFRVTVGATSAVTPTGTERWNAAEYTIDQYTDNELSSLIDPNRILNVTNPDGSLSAYRYGIPPDWMRIGVPFKNRLWMAGNAEYKVGTATITTNTATVDGTGVRWTQEMVGRQIMLDGGDGWYTIDVVTGVNQFTLDRTYAGPTLTDVEYVVTKGPFENSKLYFSEGDLFEAVPPINTVNVMKESLDDDDHITALIPKGNYMYVTKSRHLHKLAYVQQPAIDTSVTLTLTRGCLSPWSWAYVENLIYIIDELGAYKFDGNQMEPISEPIQDFWWTKIAWMAKNKFHVTWDQFAEQVLYFVVLKEDFPLIDPVTGDFSAEYPKSALVYDYRTKGWLHFKYNIAIRCSTVARIENRQHSAVAVTLPTTTPAARIWTLTDGFEDGVAKTGTRTGMNNGAAAADEIFDPGAIFPLDCVGANVEIVDGTGKGATNVIQVRDSDTTLTMIANWSPVIDGSSIYAIGGISYSIKTPRKEFDLKLEQQSRREARLHFLPQSTDWITNAQYWLNHNVLPEDQASGTDYGDNVRTAIDSPVHEIEMGPFQDSELQPGFARMPFYGRVEDYADSDRWVTIEFFGVQSPFQIEFFYIDILGVN